MRLFPKNGLQITCLLVASALAFLAGGCQTDGPHKPNPGSVQHPNLDVLHIGDKIRIDFSGTPEIIQPVETDVHQDGTVGRLALITNSIVADGKTPGELEKEITDAYVPRYYHQMGVTVTVSARFFYVGGQVGGGNNSSSGNRILYTGPTTILRAIQAAGDFTPYANRHKVQITRSIDKTIEKEDCVKALSHPELDLPVYPGDLIYVGRRGAW